MDRVEELIQKLKDVSWEVRRNAAYFLSMSKDSRAVEPLINALEDENADVRWRAASTLGKIGDKRAVEPLIKALGDENAFVRGDAASALGKIGKDAVEPLIKALGDRNERVRKNAAFALGEIKDLRAVEPLIKALGDEDEEVRENVKRSINNICKANKEKIASKYPDLICQNCLCRFKFYPALVPEPLSEKGYYACRNCEKDEFIYPVKKVIVVLDKNIQGKDNYTHEKDILYVNWFNLKKPFDFDEISILNADDFDIQEFIMKIRNDVDESRAKNYKNIVVVIKQDLFQNLSENSRRLLKNTFKDIKFG